LTDDVLKNVLINVSKASVLSKPINAYCCTWIQCFAYFVAAEKGFKDCTLSLH